ncbi:MAG TPA: HU family DNA-binding protein [Streptosporangiaceae bacterium]|jgi:DNA-binding protein HU-beta|nr:HU family DNA-binding protein [Streptosporangiaceae bacterium]
MNKRDLIDAISGRLGDKKTATEAVNAVLDTIQATVAKGDKVAITGFGVFEKAVRPARTARNPATGAPIKVAKSSVPKFRPGADFKAMVNGQKKAPVRTAKKR